MAAFDSDADGLLDLDEEGRGTNAFLFDTDGDGLFDSDETGYYGTDPNVPDSDGDAQAMARRSSTAPTRWPSAPFSRRSPTPKEPDAAAA